MTEHDRVPLFIRLRGWLTTGQAAQALGVDTRTIQRYCNKNMIPSTRVPGGWRRITPEALEHFTDTHGIIPQWEQII